MHLLPKQQLGYLFCACVLVLLIGIWQRFQLVSLHDQYKRENLLMQAISIAQTEPPLAIKDFSFQAADRQNPVFQGLNRQFANASEHMDLAGLYTVIQRDGQFVFGPESYPEGDPYASLPGTVYQNPPPQLAAAFVTRLPQVTPLYTDEFGTSVSALVPIIEPLTGHVVMVLGADLNIVRWRNSRMVIGIVPLTFTLLVIILLNGGFFVLMWRSHLPKMTRWQLRYAEAVVCALVMITLTVATAWRLRYSETLTRKGLFAALAQQHAAAVTRELNGIQNSLECLNRIFQASDHISNPEFSSYASLFTANNAIQAALWLPAVAAKDAPRVEAEAKAAGFSGFRIWQSDDKGCSVPAAGRPILFPILYHVPLDEQAKALGFDHGAEPRRATALQAALQTGQPTATDPVTLFAVTNTPYGIFVYQATTSQTQTGAVAVVVNTESLVRVPMNRVVTEHGSGLISDLFQLSARQEPLFLATSVRDPTTDIPCWHPHDNGFQLKFPFFSFGKAYGLLIYVSPAWLAAHPLRQGITTAICGLLLTILLTVFTVFLSDRRIALEREVRSRTAELKTAHNKIQTVLSAAPVSVLVFDSEGCILDANPRAGSFVDTGSSTCRHETCGVFLRCIRRHDSPGGCEKGPFCADCVLRRTIREVADGGVPVYDRDMQITTDQPDGNTKTFHLKFGASRVITGGQRQVVVAIYDITDWHHTESLYQTMFNEMHYGFMLLEPVANATPADFTCVAANPAIQRMTGLLPDTLRGKTIRQFDQTFPDELMATFVHTEKTGEAALFGLFIEAIKKHFEGTVFQPSPGQIACIFTDVTDRKEAAEKARFAAEETRRLLNETQAAQHDLIIAVEEQKRADEALIHERNLLYALMDNLPDRIYFKDIESRFMKISKAHAFSLGLATPEEAIGKSDADFKPAEVAHRIREKEKHIIATGHPLLAQVEEKKTADGKARWVSASKAPIKDAAGQVVGLVGISRDITHEIELQQQLQQASKMDAIGRLAGGVAHDFNNLLQAILGFTEILLTGVGEQDPQYEDLKQIERAAKRAADLTRQLLVFSRKQRVELQIIDINQIILTTEKMLRRLMGENIEIVLLLNADVKAIRADPSQVEQIIMNLAVNAKDAMPQGGRLTFKTNPVELQAIDTALFPESRPGMFTCLAVSDTGCGIGNDLLQHLFEPFFTTKENGKGTGLGLSVIYGIVKQSGGWVSVYTEEMQGTTFKIFLPAYEGAPVERDTESRSPEMLTLPGLGKGVLLVEDEPGVRSLAALVLQSAGYTVFACESAPLAKTLFAREGTHIDLLFSDVVLVGQNGIELAHELRNLRPGLPVLLCSGYADDSVRWESIQKEGFHFLPKPYPTVKLLTSVREILTS